MPLTETINKDIITAMKAKDEARLRALRAIKSAFLLAGTESGSKEIPDEVAIKAIQKLAKQRKDSLEIFTKENRADLADKEKEELAVLAEYLPEQMNNAAIAEVVKGIISETGAEGMKDVGKVMPLAMKALAGKADGKAISEVMKSLLS
ncbi:MAG: GatB/YqeY domain-containing protein [Bacteroidia bacterium]|nr:GatB/YqeY domain-containing protein [Bacteroidia bacterium]